MVERVLHARPHQKPDGIFCFFFICYFYFYISILFFIALFFCCYFCHFEAYSYNNVDVTDYSDGRERQCSAVVAMTASQLHVQREWNCKWVKLRFVISVPLQNVSFLMASQEHALHLLCHIVAVLRMQNAASNGMNSGRQGEWQTSRASKNNKKTKSIVFQSQSRDSHVTFENLCYDGEE